MRFPRLTAMLALSALALLASPIPANAQIAPVVTTAVASSLVIKASPGSLYGASLTAGASAGYLLIIDAIAAPADGAVTPKYCQAVAANQTIEMPWYAVPFKFNVGIVAVFSTTGCFTKTASATAFISALAK